MNQFLAVWLAGLVCFGATMNLFAQGTAFFYQGRLNDNGNPATGNYDLRFSLYDAVTNGSTIGTPQTNFAVPVNAGLFVTNLDFGAVFTGQSNWLSIGVRTNGNLGAFTILTPRQPLLPVPYAIFANTASNLLGALSATQLVGTLPSAQVAGNYFGSVNFTNATNSFTGKYFGNGAGLTNLNASALASGTVADARLSANVALLNTNQTFTGSNTFSGPIRSTDTNNFTGVNNFTNRNNAFTGSFFGNGLVGWIPVYGTATQAVANAGYLLLNTNVSTVTLPPSNSLFIGDIVRISGPGSGGWRLAQNAGQSVAGLFLTASNTTWTAANASAIGWQTVASSADGLKMVAAAGGGGGIFVSPDAGKTWNSSSATYSPFSVCSSADGVKLAGATFSGGIVISTNSGSTWSVTSANSPANWTCIASSADGSKLAATISTGNIYVSMNGGSTWTSRASSQAWNSVALSADGSRMVAVVGAGKIWTSSDFGTNWTQQTSPTTNWLSVASSEDGSKLVAVVSAAAGRIYTSADYGANWTLQAGSPSNAWYNVASASDGGRLIACSTGTPGGVYISANSGVTWTKQPLTDQTWRGVACSDDGSRMVAVHNITSTTGGIYFFGASLQNTASTTGTNGAVTGGPGTALELQYIGNDKFMPIGGRGSVWAN